MRRTNRPAVETLEGKTLLSGGLGVVPGLVGTLSAVVTKTATGTQVALTLTETNVTNHDVTFSYGAVNTGFAAIQGSKTVWESNFGVVPLWLTLDTLKAHQSISFHATWDGRANPPDPFKSPTEGPPLSGTFTITNEFDPNARAVVTLSQGSGSALPGLAPKPAHVTPPKPPVHHSH